MAILVLAMLCAVQLAPTAATGSTGGWQVIGQIGGSTQAVAIQSSYAYIGRGPAPDRA